MDTMHFYEQQGNAYCEDCYVKLFCACHDCGKVSLCRKRVASTCLRRQSLEPNQPCVNFTSRPKDKAASDSDGAQAQFVFHKACFRCHQCKAPFAGAAASASESSLSESGGDGVFRQGDHLYCRQVLL